MTSTGGLVLSRVSSLLLLALFLHMQVSCCCACDHALEAEHNEQHALGAHVGFGAGPTTEHGCEHSHSGCHLCVIAHLHYLAPTPMPAVDLALPQVGSFELVARADAQLHEDGFSKSFRPSSISLIDCGSLLRI
jgi:hypothetical protein